MNDLQLFETHENTLTKRKGNGTLENGIKREGGREVREERGGAESDRSEKKVINK